MQATVEDFGKDARPLVFALSNPVEEAECTAQQAYDWTDGTAVFVSGTAFPPVRRADGSSFIPGQCNNCLVFPGGLSSLACSPLLHNNPMPLHAHNVGPYPFKGVFAPVIGDLPWLRVLCATGEQVWGVVDAKLIWRLHLSGLHRHCLGMHGS